MRSYRSLDIYSSSLCRLSIFARSPTPDIFTFQIISPVESGVVERSFLFFELFEGLADVDGIGRRREIVGQPPQVVTKSNCGASLPNVEISDAKK